MPPDKTSRPALARNSIDIAVKSVATLGDDREILIPETDIGNATGADGALESQIVVMDGVVARFVFATVLGPTALVDQNDATSACCDSQFVVVHLHVLRRSNANFRAQEPAPVALAIVPDDIVADHSLE